MGQSCNVNVDYKWLTGQRDTVPEWVFESQGGGRYVGISDPCIDSLSGRDQALLRAWFLFQVDSRAKVQILNENFQTVEIGATRDYTSYKFNQLMQLTPKKRSVRFRIGREWVSNYGETVIEVFETKGTDYDVAFSGASGSYSMGEYITQGTEGSLSKQMIRSELTIDDSGAGTQNSTYYLMTGMVRNYDLIRTIDNNEIENHNRGRFWYSDCSLLKEKGQEPLRSKWSLENGLWHALYELLVRRVINNTTYEYKVKCVDENTNEKMNQLIRTSFSGDISLSLGTFTIKDNTVTATWNFSLK